MPTKKPQIKLTLEPSEYDVLRRLAFIQSVPMSRALYDQVHAIFPILEKIVETLEAAHRTEGAARSKLLAHAVRVHRDLEGVAGDALDQFDMFTGAVKEAAGDAARSVATRRVPAAKRAGSEGVVGAAPVPATPTKPPMRPQEKRKRARRAK